MAEIRFTQQIKDILDKNFEEYLKINGIEIEQNTEQIKNIQKILSEMRKSFTKLKKEEQFNKSYYTKNIGVEIDGLKYTINKSRKSYNQTVIQIYEELNKLASLIKMETGIRDYNIYYKSGNDYYIKKIQSKEFQNLIGKKKEKGKSKLAGTKLSQLRKDLENSIKKNNEYLEAQLAFSEHLTQFMEALESKVKLKSGDRGFAYEVFEYHMRHYGDSFGYDEEGYLNKFIPHKGSFNAEGIERGYNKQREQARWLTGGDIGLTQIKSMTKKGGFGITSIQQIEVSFNNLYDIFFNNNENEKEQLSIQDIKRLVLFLNDFHEDISTKESDKIEDRIEKEVMNIFKGLGYEVTST